MIRTIREEPLGVKEINDAIDRCDELLNIGDPLPEVRNRDPTYRTIKDQIRKTEEILFRMKRQLADLPAGPMHGKIVIPAPSEYQCKTCGNTDCLNYVKDDIKIHPSNLMAVCIIRNQTALNGCLAYLLPKEGP